MTGLSVASSSLHLKILFVELNVVVLEVPGSEGVSINSDNAVLDEGLGTDKLVIGGVVGDIKDTDLAGADLSAPRKVA